MSDFWHFNDGRASASFADCQIQLDPTNPKRGAELELGGKQWSLFAVDAQPTHGSRVLEAYARSQDLICQYGEGMDDTYRYHLYWRVLEASEESAAGVELWLGVQTGLLDSTPLLNVACGSQTDAWQVYAHSELTGLMDRNIDSVSASEVLDREAASADGSVAALVSRSAEGSAVWLVEPSDQTHAKLETSDGGPSIGLFGHFMEKGVIRRGRMRFHAFANVVSVEQVAASYAAFAKSELPLTA